MCGLDVRVCVSVCVGRKWAAREGVWFLRSFTKFYYALYALRPLATVGRAMCALGTVKPYAALVLTSIAIQTTMSNARHKPQASLES